MKTEERSLIYPGYGKYSSPIGVLEEFCSWVEIDANPGEYMLVRKTFHIHTNSPLKRMEMFNKECITVKENAQSTINTESPIKLGSTLEEVLNHPLNNHYEHYEANRF